MAPAAAEEGKEEQGMEEADTVAPTAPERQQDAASTAGEIKKKIDEAIHSLGSWCSRCSEMLQAGGRAHVTGDFERRSLEFIESELSYILVYLNKALSSQHFDDRQTMVVWMEELIRTVPDALSEADPQRENTLLRKATQCFHRSRRYSVKLQSYALNLYALATRSNWYGHLSTAISCHGLPPPLSPVNLGLYPSYQDIPYVNFLLMMSVIMIPYGYKFEKDRLFRKLFCETSIPYFNSAEVDRYFSDLVNLNAISDEAANSRLGDADEAGAWQWNVNQHDHQVLVSESAGMDFIYTSDTLNLLEADFATYIRKEASRTPRRLALHHDVPDIQSLLQYVDLLQTRSLAVSGAVSRSVPLHRFRNLVVLDVEGWKNFGDAELFRICKAKMFFLVYLSITNTGVSKFPPEIKELCSLQVLDASYTQVTELHLGDFEETRLHRLDLRGTPIRKLTIPKQTLELQVILNTLLLGGEGMVKSTETAPILPHDIRHFERLRILATVDLSKQPASFINALGELCYLKVLAITWSFHQSSDRDYCEGLLSSIKKWKDLQSLTIHCGYGCSMEFLGSISGPPEKLEKFKVIAGRFVVVPQWFHGLEHLSFVQITVCKLEPHDLEILRDLPTLKCLVLGLDFIPKEAIVFQNEGFHELQRFSVECPVPWLTFESGAMPMLTYLQLELHPCPTSPVSVPMDISNLRSLAKVALWYNVRHANSSSIKRTVEAMRKEVAECHNATKMVSLLINGTERGDVQTVDGETESATGAPSGTDAGPEGDVQEVDEITQAQSCSKAYAHSPGDME